MIKQRQQQPALPNIIRHFLEQAQKLYFTIISSRVAESF
jgi:hypothetical protein